MVAKNSDGQLNSDERASTPKDWEGYYASRHDEALSYHPIDHDDFRNLPHKLIFDKIAQFYKGGTILEVGAGDSDILIDLWKKFKPVYCAGLDYVDIACKKLEKKSAQAGAKIDVICADMFSPPENTLGKFDFVMSYGVVEHFHDLPMVLATIGKFAKRGGTVFTLIPNNKNTPYGWLMRLWNKEVFDAHVLYGLDDLLEAYRQAGLEVIWGGHLCSSNFGMLSWCFKERKRGVNFWIYKQLTRLSKLVWLAESRLGKRLPATRFLSPYIVVVGKRPQ